MNKRLTRISKYMSFILSHEPGSIGLKLDAEGWCSLEEFVEKANASGKSVTADQVLAVVAESEKQRFELNEDNSRVRAVKVSRKAMRKETRLAAAKSSVVKEPVAEPASTPEPTAKPETTPAKKPATGKPVFTRSRLVQRSKSD